MDTNQSGVSLDDVAALIEDEEQEEVLDESEAEEVESQEDDQAEEAQEDEAEEAFAEIEYEGKTYKVPQELKESFLRQSDYTRKTQEVAEQRKAVEARAELLNQQFTVSTQTIEKQVELLSIRSKLAEFKQLDWQALVNEDPVQATKLNIAFQQLQAQAQEKYAELQQAQGQAQHLAQQQRQQMLAQSQKDLMQRIPSFNEGTAKQIRSAAATYGITDEEISQVIDARYVHILHDAMQWRALQQQKPQAMKKVAEAPKVLKPQAPRPRNEQRERELDGRFKAGSASLSDLAKFIDSH